MMTHSIIATHRRLHYRTIGNSIDYILLQLLSFHRAMSYEPHDENKDLKFTMFSVH